VVVACEAWRLVVEWGIVDDLLAVLDLLLLPLLLLSVVVVGEGDISGCNASLESSSPFCSLFFLTAGSSDNALSSSCSNTDSFLAALRFLLDFLEEEEVDDLLDSFLRR